MPKFRVSFDVEAETAENVAEFLREDVSTISAEVNYGVSFVSRAVIEPWVTIPE